MRRLALLLALACAAPAQAAPRQVAKAPMHFALAGDQVLVARADGRTLTVRAHPAGRRIFSYEAPRGTRPGAVIAASAQRAALTVFLSRGVSDISAAQTFLGPAHGPWTALGPMTDLRTGFPWNHQVDGERVFTIESRGSLTDTVVIVRDAETRELALPYDAIFAGELVAYTAQVPGQGPDELGRRLVVAEWRSGRTRYTTDLPETIDQFALHPSGRVALTLDALEGVFDVRPGAAPRRVSRRTPELDAPFAFAGDRLVFAQEGLWVIEPGGRVRRFGVPTKDLTSFTTDDRRVLWLANGCLLVARVTEPLARAPGRGPCPRSEILLDDGARDARAARTIPVALRCISAPRRCTGTVRLRLGLRRASGPRRFSIPAGTTRRVRVRLDDRAYRTVSRRRETTLVVEPRTDDGDRPPGNHTQAITVVRE